MEQTPLGTSESPRSYAFILPTLIAFVVIGAGIYLIAKNESSINTEQELTVEEAKKQTVFCREEGEEGKYDSCIVETFKEDGQWYIRATYKNVHDDSVLSSRSTVKATWFGDEWILSEEVQEVQCRPGRGHEDFSTEPCV